MKKREVKIVKRDAKPKAPRVATADEVKLQQVKDEADGERNMVDTVKTWITERSKQSAADDIDSKKRLFAWEGDNLINQK